MLVGVVYYQQNYPNILSCFQSLSDVHPYSLCEKLAPKYASISGDELNTSHDFYKDLLRYQISFLLTSIQHHLAPINILPN